MVEIQFHETVVAAKHGAYKKFLAWLEDIDMSEYPIPTNKDCCNSSPSPHMASCKHMIDIINLSQDCCSKCRDKEDMGWSYKKLDTKNKTRRLSGEWHRLET